MAEYKGLVQISTSPTVEITADDWPTVFRQAAEEASRGKGQLLAVNIEHDHEFLTRRLVLVFEEA